MADVKICGLTDPQSVRATLDGGARFIGFMFFAKSPRNVTLDQAAALAGPARGRAEIVAVTVDASDDALAAIQTVLKPDYIQGHGAETPARVAAMRRFAPKGVIKAFGIATAEDLAATAQFQEADYLLLDAKAPAGAERPGGNGAAFDWTILQGRRLPRPWMLSGGLTPQNAAEAIALSGAALVDVSSGVEARPGVKDPERIAAFLAAAGARPAR